MSNNAASSQQQQDATATASTLTDDNNNKKSSVRQQLFAVPVAATAMQRSQVDLSSQFSSQEILTQNPDLTQNTELLDILSPTFLQTPVATLWGRLLPAQGGAPIDLTMPQQVDTNNNNNNTEIVAEIIIGRHSKCNVCIPTPKLCVSNSKHKQLLQWAHAMISNRHCKIVCTRQCNNSSHEYQVHVEDNSHNGTLVNKTVLLRKGQKRILHAGDEILLISPQIVQKRLKKQPVDAQQYILNLLQPFTFVFCSPNDHLSSRNNTFGKPLTIEKLLLPTDSIQEQEMLSPVLSTSQTPAVDARSAISCTSPLPSFLTNSHSYIELDYDLRQIIGRGTMGQVYRAIHRATGQERAVKVISTKGWQLNDSQNAMPWHAEAAILRELEHPYIVQLHDVYASQQAIYLVMELVNGGDLFDRIVARERYTEVKARRVLRRLLNALYYLHEHCQIVHRDIKPENILLLDNDDDVSIKLTDFGLAKACSPEGLGTFCGTPQYFAPEVFLRQVKSSSAKTDNSSGNNNPDRYGKPADLWSVGVILYALLSGTLPFEGQGVYTNAELDFDGPVWKEISPLAKDLVKQLLNFDPQKRLTVEKACQHSWILVDDGDSHTNPLCDPNVELPLQKNGPSVMNSYTSPPKAKSPTKSMFASANLLLPELASHERNKAKCADNTNDDKNTRKSVYADTPSSDTTASLDDVVSNYDGLQDTKRSLLGPSESCDDGDLQGSNGRVKSIEDVPNDPELTSSSKTCGKVSTAGSSAELPRRPLSPLLLNERHNDFRKQIIACSELKTKNKAKKTTQSKTKAVAPRTSLETSAACSFSPSKVALEVLNEIPDVDISSVCSDDSESISSFQSLQDDANNKSLEASDMPLLNTKDTSPAPIIVLGSEEKKAGKRRLATTVGRKKTGKLSKKPKVAKKSLERKADEKSTCKQTKISKWLKSCND